MQHSSQSALQGDFGPMHQNIMKNGNESIMKMQPNYHKKPLNVEQPDSTFLPHLAPGMNPLLQFALSPVSQTICNHETELRNSCYFRKLFNKLYSSINKCITYHVTFVQTVHTSLKSTKARTDRSRLRA